MKKSLIALAALAAVGAASAQSSVTLYGAVDIGYGAHKTETRNGSGSIKSSGVMDGANAGNRIGFRGTEDLGGGLKANFVVEQGISPTNGSLFGVRSGSAGHQIAGFSAAGVATAAVAPHQTTPLPRGSSATPAPHTHMPHAFSRWRPTVSESLPVKN